ncbi:prolyl-tRNA editing protein ProX-like [Saccoglossus kowalevskii]
MATDRKGGVGGRDYLLATLQNLGITLSTVAYHEAGERDGMCGVFCKNLFLKDRKGTFYLIICEEDCKVDLKWLKRHLNAARNFSFASADDLYAQLHINPGSVSPFALINNTRRDIQVIIDRNLQPYNNSLNFHPLDSKETSLISFDDLIRFLDHLGYQPVITDMHQM